MPGAMEVDSSPPKADTDPVTMNGVNGQTDDEPADPAPHALDALKGKDGGDRPQTPAQRDDDKENANGHNGTLHNGAAADTSADSQVGADQEGGDHDTNNTSDKYHTSPNNSDNMDHKDHMQEDQDDESIEEYLKASETTDHNNESLNESKQDNFNDMSEEDPLEKSPNCEAKEKESEEHNAENCKPDANDDTNVLPELNEKQNSSSSDNANGNIAKDEAVVVIDASPAKQGPSNVIVVKSPPKKPTKVDRMLAATKGSDSSGKTGGENMRPFAKLLFDLGLDLCRQQVYKDLIKVQKKKENHNKLNDNEKVQLETLKDAYDHLVDKNEQFQRESVKCPNCSFKSDLVNPLELHKEYEHSGACAICGFTTQNIYSFYFHMEAEHNRQGRVQPVVGMHTCPYCPYEHHSSRKNFLKHLTKCEAHFKLYKNLQPAPSDCDIPLKAPPVSAGSKAVQRTAPAAQKKPESRLAARPAQGAGQQVVLPPGVLGAQGSAPWPAGQDQSGPQLVQVGNQYFLVVQQNGQTFMTPMVAGAQANAAAPQKAVPKPPGSTATPIQSNTSTKDTAVPPGQYEICEICGGFVKDKESLRIHFFHAHKIEIHPSVMKERSPSLSCQHCSQAFWTYQGYKRHCLVSHPTAKDFKQLMTCYVCTKQVPDFITHMTSKHPQVVRHMLSQIRCVVCQAAFPSETALESHMLQDHKDIVTKYGSLAGPEKPATPTAKTSPQKSSNPSKNNATPIGLYSNASSLKTCSRCSFKYTTMASYKAHFAKSHGDEEEICEVCEELVKVGRPHIDHVTSKHLRPLQVTLSRLTPQDLAGPRQPLRKRKRSAEEVIVIDLDSQKRAKPNNAEEDPAPDPPSSQSDQPEDQSDTEVINAEDIVDLDKSDNSAKSDDSVHNSQTVTEEIIEVDGEKIVVQKLDG